jgi:hypothetical protein
MVDGRHVRVDLELHHLVGGPHRVREQEHRVRKDELPNVMVDKLLHLKDLVEGKHLRIDRIIGSGVYTRGRWSTYAVYHKDGKKRNWIMASKWAKIGSTYTLSNFDIYRR